MRRFELSEGSSNKFWEIAVEGAGYTVRYGKIGTDGQLQSKSFSTQAAALKQAEKVIAEKLGKGYREIGADSDRVSSRGGAKADAKSADGEVSPGLGRSMRKSCRSPPNSDRSSFRGVVRWSLRSRCRFPRPGQESTRTTFASKVLGATAAYRSPIDSRTKLH